MSNALIAYGNVIDASAISGGSWLYALPLLNLQKKTLGKVARSTDVLATSTKFTVDVGNASVLRTIALANHNLSLDATLRVRASNDPTFATSVIDSGWFDVWPVVYNSENLDWQSDNFWSGKYSDKDRQGYTWTAIWSADRSVTCRYWLFEINDTENLDGYVQVGRCFIGEAWQPTVNMSIGAAIGWETNTEVQEASSGSEYFDPKKPFRVAKFSTDWMNEDEAFGNAFDIKRRVGLDGEVVYQFNPEDTLHAIRRQYLGRMRELSPIEWPYSTINSTGWIIKELL